MDENYDELLQRIRAKCLQQRWHGPDIMNPFKIVERERLRQEKEKERLERLRKENPSKKQYFLVGGGGTFYWYDRKGKQYAINAATDLEKFPLQTEFECPPVTEEQLIAAENALGYSLPPLLRAIYTRVANGGFGPSYGLDGVSTEIASLSDGSPWRSSYRPIDLAVYLRKNSSVDYFEFPWYVWPDSLFILCDWGCGYFSYVDCVSGRVFYGGAGKIGHGLRSQASSLYEWFELWLRGINLETSIYARSGEQEDE